MNVHDIVLPLIDADGRTTTEIARTIAVHPSRLSRFRSRSEGLSLSVLRRLLIEVNANDAARAEAVRAWTEAQS